MMIYRVSHRAVYPRLPTKYYAFLLACCLTSYNINLIINYLNANIINVYV
uniref:Uncharacterized protein n=1 Tax=Aster yellows phytoplasma TaxID=35779 RepID=Q847Q6_ASTYP|nr:hypothetical protein [Aster yellows phytoplasma]